MNNRKHAVTEHSEVAPQCEQKYITFRSATDQSTILKFAKKLAKHSRTQNENNTQVCPNNSNTGWAKKVSCNTMVDIYVQYFLNINKLEAAVESRQPDNSSKVKYSIMCFIYAVKYSMIQP